MQPSCLSNNGFGPNIPSENYFTCLGCCSQYFDLHEDEERRNERMPLVGLYTAVASLICSLAMAVDTFPIFRRKRFWFPIKYFTLNAASLTLIAVAMRLPLDISTDMEESADQLSKLSSVVFMCTVMGFLMPSLGQMSNKELVVNITALGILVITIFVNSWFQWNIQVLYFVLVATPMFIMVILLILLSFSALTVPSTRKYIDIRYREIKKLAIDEKSTGKKKINVDDLKEDVRKYWIMAVTGSPQFVMARLVTCFTIGIICSTIVGYLVCTEVIYFSIYRFSYLTRHESNYKWSTSVVHVIQIVGIAISVLVCTGRWLTVIEMKCSGIGERSLKTFQVEKYWTETLVDRKERPLGMRTRGQKCRKLVRTVENIVLCFCIRVQILIVKACKFLQHLFVVSVSFFLSCRNYIKRLRPLTSSEYHTGSESKSVRNMELNNYVLSLEGETELPERLLKNMCDFADHLMEMGRRRQLKHLKGLLEKSNGFNGVAKFDSKQVQSLDSYEPPNSWMLPVVTLTSIAIALPNIGNQSVDGLLRSVSEGIVYIDLIEKDLNATGDLIGIRKAAEMVWSGMELHGKWLDQDLRKIGTGEQNSKGTLQNLASISKTIVLDFIANNEILKENSLKWPVNIVAANSMYRTSETLLLDRNLDTENIDERLFEKISVMISDILAACLTNLPRVITKKCFCDDIENREESVQQAAHLLGETEEILKLIEQHEMPNLDQDQAAYIDKWRAIIKQENPLAISSSSNELGTTSSSFSEIHVAI